MRTCDYTRTHARTRAHRERERERESQVHVDTRRTRASIEHVCKCAVSRSTVSKRTHSSKNTFLLYAYCKCAVSRSTYVSAARMSPQHVCLTLTYASLHVVVWSPVYLYREAFAAVHWSMHLCDNLYIGACVCI